MAARQTHPEHANRLIHEASPYLLQHAYNPVDWYPWGSDAFRVAAESDRPVFLSIGYSTCHWCHVMERESFEDEATAAILNDHFVSIKVDREERPDVDETYMKAVQMMTGSGGWPLSIFLTPQGRPFYGGTYFPPRSMYGRPSFQQLLLAIAQAWRDRRAELLSSADKATDALQSLNVTGSSAPLSIEVLEKAVVRLSGVFDASHGGFGDAPKFPQPGTLAFLISYGHRTGNAKALEMVTGTLDAMAAGGIHDHLGGGFHRYSTDRQWLVPHFEKMLYDQALLAKVYVQAYQASSREHYAIVGRDIFDYILRDLTDSAGGFYAGEDADSEGKEGTFYVWTQAEIEAVLSSDEARLFFDGYGVTKKGNFENGTNILHVTGSDNSRGIESELAGIRRKLLEHRNARPRPHRDDKIIAGWNGLMISALAYGGAVLAEPSYVTAAERAARFVLESLRAEDRLMRYHRDGRAVEKGFLDDYAFMIDGLIDLYQATFDAGWLREAANLADQMISLFSDGSSSGFFLSGEDVERLIVREKPAYDGAVPSGNSVAAGVLFRLGRMTGDERYASHAQGVLDTFSGALADSPTAFTAMLTALGLSLGSGQEIVIAHSEHAAEGKILIDEVRRHFLPDAVLMVRPFDPEGREIVRTAPFLVRLGPVEGHAAAYVCRGHACQRPVTNPEDLRQILRSISGN